MLEKQDYNNSYKVSTFKKKMLDVLNPEEMEVEGAIEFPRIISGTEALDIFLEIAENCEFGSQYELFERTDSIKRKGLEESKWKTIDFKGILMRNYSPGDGDVVGIRFYRGVLVDPHEFSGFFAGYLGHATRPERRLVNEVLNYAKIYADANFEGEPFSIGTIAGRRESRVYTKEEIETAQRSS